MQGQAGFWDIDERYVRLSEAGDPLEKLNAVVPWEVFRKSLSKALGSVINFVCSGAVEHYAARQLQSFGQTRHIGSPAHISAILSKIIDAMTETIPDIERYTRENSKFAEIGERMIASWTEGIEKTLKK